jgi:hypothetical protein
LGILVFLLDLAVSVRRGKPCGGCFGAAGRGLDLPACIVDNPTAEQFQWAHKGMSIDKWKVVDSEQAIGEFLRETHGLHDSCITSAEFSDGRFVDESGSMHCGCGDRATLMLKFDRQAGMGRVEKCVLAFDGVFEFDFTHLAADDGIILSCSVSMMDNAVCFQCNPGYEKPNPTVRAKLFKYVVFGT